MMTVNAPTRISVKRQRKELKILKSIMIQLGIYSIGSVPLMVIAICSQIPTVVRIPDELYLLSNVSIPLCVTLILIFVCMTNRSIRKTLFIS